MDNQTTVNIFRKRNIVTYVKMMRKWINVHCNSGFIKTNIIGKLKGSPGGVWYNPDRDSNILSMAKVEKYLPVTYGREKCFIVNKVDGAQRRFIK